jgi:sulfur-oxidizing protein SoxY
MRPFPARRQFLARVAGLALLPAAARAADDTPVETIVPVIKNVTRGAPVKAGRVKLEIPRLADNGNSVALRVSVDSPMTAADHVRAIHLFSETNPRPVIATLHLGPHAGRAQVVTRVRLSRAQRVVAIAEMSDGSFWSDVAEVSVTASACEDQG